MEMPELLARRFHELYEFLAPSFGYETRTESAKSWEEIPENNKQLMIAVCTELCNIYKIKVSTRWLLDNIERYPEDDSEIYK